MRRRNSSGNGSLPSSTLRRSPRFQQENQPNPECPKTPKCVSRRNRIPLSDLTPVSSVTAEDSPNKSLKLQGSRSSTSSKRCKKGSSGSGKSSGLNGGAQGFPGVRRSARLSENANVQKTGLAGSVGAIASDRPKERSSSNGGKMSRVVNLRNGTVSVPEKRVNRGSSRYSNKRDGRDLVKGSNSLRKCSSIEDRGAENKSDKAKADGAANLSDQCSYKIEKRVTRSASRKYKDVRSSESRGVKDLSDEGKAKLGANLFGDPISDNRDMAKSVRGGDRMKGFEAEKKLTGTKRRSIEVREEHVTSDGWTTEQELALEKAYFQAKPTPSFWKKVAKMVPGKSAQECFDKIHSELVTPPQRQPRSRAVAAKSPVVLSASKLLNSPAPQTKKQRYNKQKNAHKTVRQLLEKQCCLDQDSNGDLFSVLEQTSDPPTQVRDTRLLFTPERHIEEPPSYKRCMERSLASRKFLSQLNNSCEAALTSPPVLKKIKNKVLHEKYIDKLHCREAKRRAASLRTGKSTKGENGAKGYYVQKTEAVKDAKNALVFCAKDAINQFNRLQRSKMDTFETALDDFADGSEHESEDES